MTFRDLGYGYGKDNRNVYSFGKVLEYVDPSSFRVSRHFAPRQGCEWSYHYDYDFDDEYCDEYYDEYCRGGYRITSFDVYYRGRKVKDASVVSFKMLGDGYAKDAFNTYYMGREVDDVPIRYR